MSMYKTIQISFNLGDPFQEKLYNYFKSQGKNSSLYGKMLIQRDMEQNSKVEPITANEGLEPIKEIEKVSGLEPIKISIGSEFKLL